MIINFLAFKPQLEKEEIISLQNYIKKAEYSIWLKNVWFTHQNLKKILFNQIHKGLSVHIILSPDFAEEYSDYFNFNEFVDYGGELFILNKKNMKALKNTQFMLIDNRIIVQNSPDSQFEAETHDLIKEGWANYLIKAYTDWFLYLQSVSYSIF